MLQGHLSESLKSRVIQPSGRGRRSAETSSASILQAQAQASSLAAAYPGYAGLSGLSGLNSTASLMAAYSKMPMSALSFGGIPGMSLAAANPLYAQMYASMMPHLYGGLSSENPEDTPPEDKELGEVKTTEEPVKKERHKDRKDKSSPKSSKASSSTSGASGTTSTSPSGSSTNPHSAFPFMYNPMMFNSLYAQSLAGSFSLPSGLPTSFASLTQAQHMMNGVGDSDDEGRKSSSSSKKAHSASSTSIDSQYMAEDLSMRAPLGRSKHDKHGAQDLSVKKRIREEGVEDLSVSKRHAHDRSPEDLTVKRKCSESERTKPVELNIPKPPTHHHRPHKKSKGLDNIVSSLAKKKGIDSLAESLTKRAESKLSPKKDSVADLSKKVSEDS